MGFVEVIGFWESLLGVIIFGTLAVIPSKYLTKKYKDPNNIVNKPWFRLLFGIAAAGSLINLL